MKASRLLAPSGFGFCVREVYTTQIVHNTMPTSLSSPTSEYDKEQRILFVSCEVLLKAPHSYAGLQPQVSSVVDIWNPKPT